MASTAALPILPSSRDASMIDISQTARILRVSPATARQLAQQGRLPVRAIRVGHSWRVPYMPLIQALGIAPKHVRTSPEI